MTTITPVFRNAILLLLVVTGALNTIAYKFQNTQMVYEGSYFKYFFHPYMQATTMFVGEFLCIFLYLFMKRRDPEAFTRRMRQSKSKGKKTEFNPLLLAIPAFCDCLTSTMQYIALNFISGSVYQMLRGGVIVSTAILSRYVLKMEQRRNHVVGCVIAISGILVVGVSNVVFADHSDSGSSSNLAILGYLLIVASLVTNGLFFVSEEKLYNAYHLEPLQVVGWEGFFGLCFYAVILPIISFVPCNFGVQACVFSEQNYPYIERPGAYFSEAASNWALMLFVILGVFSIASFNVCGSTVTKYINALARSLADVTRTIVIWLVGIIITVTAGKTHPNYKWQNVKVGAILLELVGFVILVFGNLIYNRMVNIPILVGKAPEELAEETSSDYNVSLQPTKDEDV